MGITLIAKRSAWLFFQCRNKSRNKAQRVRGRKTECAGSPGSETTDAACRARGVRSPALSAQAAVSAAMAAAERPGMGPFGVFCDLAPAVRPPTRNTCGFSAHETEMRPHSIRSPRTDGRM